MGLFRRSHAPVHVRCPRCSLEWEDRGHSPFLGAFLVALVLLLTSGGVAGAVWWIDRGSTGGPFAGPTGPEGTGEAVPNLQVADRRIVEGDEGTTEAIFRVTLSSPAQKRLTVRYETEDGRALADMDYEPVSGTLTFPPGDTNRKVTVEIIGDIEDEPNETFFVTLLDSPEIVVTDPEGIGTIRDDDDALVSIEDVGVIEGDTGTVAAEFDVSVTTTAEETISVDYSTGDRTAVAQQDYQPTSGTLTFSSDETARTVTVAVIGDTVEEPDESFEVVLADPKTGDVLVRGQGRIENDDGGAVVPVTISITDATVPEGNAGPTNATFQVALSSSSAQTVSVNFASSDGKAQVQNQDYQATSGNLKFAPGEGSKNVTVAVNGDTAIEPDETFFVSLSGAVNATILDGQGRGTIDNDDFPSMAIGDDFVVESAGPATFFVFLSQPAQETVTVMYTTQDGEALANEDYEPLAGTLTFNPGEDQKTVEVSIIDDPVNENDEAFFVVLSNATNATITEGTGDCIIENDDP